MEFIKKTAWYGVPVTIAAIMAVALLFAGPAKEAKADSAITLAAVAFTAPTHLAGLVETWTIAFTLNGSSDDDLASGDKVIVTFPTGFVIPAVPTASLTGTHWVGAGCATPTAATVGQVVTITSAGVCIFDDSEGTDATVTIAGITNPAAAQFAVTTAKVAIDAADAAHDVAAVNSSAVLEIVGVAVTTSAASIVGNGFNSVVITLNPSETATNTGGGVLTATTTAGTILSVPAPTNGGLWSAAGVVAAGGLSVSNSVEATIADTNETFTLKSPVVTAATVATVTLRVTPAAGGDAIVLGSVKVTFGLAKSLGSITLGTPSVAAPKADGTELSTMTVTVKDTAGVAFANASTTLKVAITTAGAVDSDGTTCDLLGGAKTSGSDSDCSYTMDVTDGIDSIGIFGDGTSSTGIVTVSHTATDGTVTSATKSFVFVGGTVASMKLSMVRTNTTTSGIAKGIVRNTGSTTGEDELILVAEALDANGNSLVVAGNVTFAITDSAGAAAPTGFFSAAGLTETLTDSNAGTTASGGVSGATSATCKDVVQAGALLKKAGAVCIIDIDSTTGIATGTYTVTVSHGAGALKKSTTGTFVLAEKSAAIAVTATAVEVGSTGTVTAVVTDSAGNPVADGTSVSFTAGAGVILQLASSGNLGNQASTTSAGSVTLNVIGLAAGDVTIFANIGTVQGNLIVAVGGAAAVVTPVAEPVVVTPSVLTAPPSGGFSQGTAGTTDRQAFADAQSFTVTIMWRFDIANQSWQSFIPVAGTPEIAQTMKTLAATDIVTAYAK